MPDNFPKIGYCVLQFYELNKQANCSMFIRLATEYVVCSLYCTLRVRKPFWSSVSLRRPTGIQQILVDVLQIQHVHGQTRLDGENGKGFYGSCRSEYQEREKERGREKEREREEGNTKRAESVANLINILRS